MVIITNNLLKQRGGDSALSVFAIVNRLYSALNTPQTGIVQGMQPLVGYNLRAEEVRAGTEALSGYPSAPRWFMDGWSAASAW